MQVCKYLTRLSAFIKRSFLISKETENFLISATEHAHFIHEMSLEWEIKELQWNGMSME